VNMMINPAALPTPAAANKESINFSGKSEGSFLNHILRLMKSDDRQNLLGVAMSDNAKAAVAQGKSVIKIKSNEQSRPTGNDIALLSVPKRLQELLNNLRNSLEKGSAVPGEWNLTLPDMSLLNQAAQDAGMSKSDLGVLVKKMQENGGRLDLEQFLQFFSNHFAKIDTESPIKLPETELPLLLNLLTRMGVGQGDIQKINDAVVAGDNQFDLKMFVQQLNSIVDRQNLIAGSQNPVITGAAESVAPQATSLTRGEKEQLVDLFRKAGVSEQMLAAMFVEKAADDSFSLALAGFQDMFVQGLNDIERNKPQVDFKNFFADLTQALSESGFKGTTIVLTPVVSKALEEVYRELVGLVDFSKIQVRQSPVLQNSEKIVDGKAVTALQEGKVEQLTNRKKAELEIDAPDHKDATYEQALIDLKKFIVDLAGALSLSGYNDKPVAMTSDQQQALEAAYQELVGIVDFARIQVQVQQTLAPFIPAKSVEVDPAFSQVHGEVVRLSQVEKEQLANLLSKADVSEEMLATLLAGPTGDHSSGPVLSQVKEILSQGIKGIEQKQPQAELNKFIADFVQTLAESGVNGKRVALTPDLQKSIESLSQELIGKVDFAKIQVLQASAPFDSAGLPAAPAPVVSDRQTEKDSQLSTVEKAQLLDLLSKAGVGKETLAAMFTKAGDDHSTLELLQFKEILSQGLKEIRLKQPQADLKKIVVDLAQALAGTGVSGNPVELTPDLRQFVDVLTQDLSAPVDSFKIKSQIQQANDQSETAKSVGPFFPSRESEIDQVVSQDNVGAGEVKKVAPADTKFKSAAFDSSVDSKVQSPAGKTETVLGMPSEHSGGVYRTVAEQPQVIPAPRHIPEFDRQILTQFTNGILKGLKNGEHHMILKLNPKELGEVRVELMIKDQQMSVSFAMENSKVKEIIENHMGMFKESMANKGFVVQDCLVSVGQQNQQKDAWQRFTDSFKQKSGGNGHGPERLSDLPREILYNRSDFRRPDGISIIV